MEYSLDGAPDEPDTSDWNAICAPGPEAFFEKLFHEVGGFGLPASVVTSDNQDDPVRRVKTGWRGDKTLGAEITVVECPETSDFPVYCSWETHGLPGMTVKWDYALEYAGQLGHVAFRHRRLQCAFEGAADQERFSRIWHAVFGKMPRFAP